MKAQDKGTGEKPLTPPERNMNAKKRSKKSVRTARDSIRVESISPDHSQSPLRHDIWENENRTEILLEFKVRSSDEIGEESAVKNRDKTGKTGKNHRVQKRNPEIDSGKLSCKQINPVIKSVLPFL